MEFVASTSLTRGHVTLTPLRTQTLVVWNIFTLCCWKGFFFPHRPSWHLPHKLLYSNWTSMLNLTVKRHNLTNKVLYHYNAFILLPTKEKSIEPIEIFLLVYVKFDSCLLEIREKTNIYTHFHAENSWLWKHLTMTFICVESSVLFWLRTALLL